MASNGAAPLSFGAITASNVAAEACTAQLRPPVPLECPPPAISDERPSATAERLTSDGPPVASGARHSAVETSSPVRTSVLDGYASMKLWRLPTPEPSAVRVPDDNSEWG